MSRGSARIGKIFNEACRVQMGGGFRTVLSKEEFANKFCPELLEGYEIKVPYGGIRTTSRGRSINWSNPAIAKSQNTKRARELDQIYAHCLPVMQAGVAEWQQNPEAMEKLSAAHEQRTEEEN